MRISLAYTRILGAVLALFAITAASSRAQPANEPATIVIAVIKDYPLFKPSERSRATDELRAIVIPRDLVDKGRSMVILNPAHVTPEVLYAALGHLNAASTPEHQMKFIVISRQSTPAASALPPSVFSALSATIRELLAAQPSGVRGHPSGKHIVLTEKMRRMIAEASLRPSR